MRNALAAIYRWLALRDHLATTILLVVIGGLILGGVTTSNHGIDGLREDGARVSSDQWGAAQSIRSDEYWVSTPTALSIMETGGSPTFSPLGAPSGFVMRYSDGGVASSIVFFHLGALRTAAFLPEEVAFALYWWIPVLALFIGLPRWFGHVAGRRRLGWLAAALIFLSPSNQWWSMGPLNCIAFAVLGSALLIDSFRALEKRRYVVAALTGAGAAVSLTGIPTMYAPWSIALGVPVLLATVLWILTRSGTGWRTRIIPVAAVGAVSLGLTALVFLENAAGLQALTSTLYPGARRTFAESMSIARLLGAPGLGELASSTPITSNASSITSSYTIAFLWAAFLVAGATGLRILRRNPVVLTIGGFGAVLLAWATLALGERSSLAPLLNLIPANRVVGVVGILAIILVCLLLALIPTGTRLGVAVVAAITTGWLTAYAVSQVKLEFLPELSTLTILGSGAGVAVAVFLLSRYPLKIWAIGLVALLAIVPVIGSNPVIVGLGDLRGTAVMDELQDAGREARADGTLWASNSVWFDAAMLSAGLPSLSGVQRSGPDAAEWERLDPTGAAEEAWNRGGGFIFFDWTPGEDTEIMSPQSDVIIVAIDPCELAQVFPEVTTIASLEALDGECLSPTGTLEWGGEKQYLYAVD